MPATLLIPLLLTGCVSITAPELLLAPDAARDGLEGTDGPYGAAIVDSWAQARLRDAIELSIVYPALDDRSPDLTEAPYPTVLLVHGGLVSRERYHWLAAHTASRGYVVVLPEHAMDLAIFEPANSSIALDHYERLTQEPHTLAGMGEADGPAAVVGHSLGGVVGTMAWQDEPSIRGLALLASFPAGGPDADLSAQAGRPVLGLAGETDGSVSPDEMQANLEVFPDPPRFGVVQGMNHFAWCDDNSPADLADDGPLEGDLDTIRQHAQHALDSWLDAELKDDTDAAERIDGDGIEGVEWP